MNDSPGKPKTERRAGNPGSGVAFGRDPGSGHRYPFPALVGQEQLRRALLALCVDPRIGGLLVLGDKGTGKSTAIRAIAALLAPAPLVEIPLNATEDALLGCLDLEHAVRQGQRRATPGLLHRADGGLLYVDEVNLLADHLADLLLTAAADGRVRLEREGMSGHYAARFALVGSMNPEEGALRPHFLDRFGLCLAVTGLQELTQRAELVRRRLAFEADPERFVRRYEDEQAQLRQAILRAREDLRRLCFPEALLKQAVNLAIEAGVAGHRADLAMRRTALALAALDGAAAVLPSHLEEAASLTLQHRERPKAPPQRQAKENPPRPPDESPESTSEPHGPESAASQPETGAPQPGDETSHSPERPDAGDSDNQPELPPQGGLRPASERMAPLGEPFRIKQLPLRRDRLLRSGSGRRSTSRSCTAAGRTVRSVEKATAGGLAIDATLRAAAPHQQRRTGGNAAMVIEKQDYRYKVRERKTGSFILLAVDASGSMGAEQRMVEAKKAVLSLLLDAYQRRDKVGLVAFRGKTADVLAQPTGSMELAFRLLADLPTGGRTPLAAGLELGLRLCRNELRKHPAALPLLIVISDGRATAASHGGDPVREALAVASEIAADPRIRSLVLDVEPPGYLALGLARSLAQAMGAVCWQTTDLKAETIFNAVRTLDASPPAATLPTFRTWRSGDDL